MKNDSHIFPFSTMDDKFFDSNKDGKLTGTETIFRDAHLKEMNDTLDNEVKNATPVRSNGSGVSFTAIVLFVLFILWIITK